MSKRKRNINEDKIKKYIIDKTLAKNISYVHNYYELNDIIVTRGVINENE
ncbi:MAG: hypothetical protein AB2417_11090 [Clostridiaceae bacterium]